MGLGRANVLAFSCEGRTPTSKSSRQARVCGSEAPADVSRRAAAEVETGLRQLQRPVGRRGVVLDLLHVRVGLGCTRVWGPRPWGATLSRLLRERGTGMPRSHDNGAGGGSLRSRRRATSHRGSAPSANSSPNAEVFIHSEIPCASTRARCEGSTSTPTRGSREVPNVRRSRGAANIARTPTPS